jgi:glycosyltransferase involved in cell wall biosynthesis
MEKGPLVSILIPNRNHSLYLSQAIESALAQTYDNIEIIVCDNCSEDNSLEVVMKYLNRGVLINKNPINIFSHNYDILSHIAEGEYFMVLCADDLIKPTFVESLVRVMEKYPKIGYVHCERDYVDVNGNVIELDPFFNCSFMVNGKAMLPIYMMTDVAQAAQGLIRRSAFEKIGGHDTETDYTNIDREQWFRLSMISDYAYIREKLSLIRVHQESATTASSNVFMHPLLLYKMLEGFIEWGKIKNYPAVLEREKAALKKLAKDFLVLAVKYIKQNNFSIAKKYLLFIRIIDKDSVSDIKYLKCINICENQDLSMIHELDQFLKDTDVFHKRNYNPPNEFIRLYEGGITNNE